VLRTVLIVDDHPAFRAAARAMLDAEGFRVIGEAGDGPAALEAAVQLHPAVVLLDVQLPGLDGFAVAELLAGLSDPPQVVLVSSRSAATYGERAATTAAIGFLSKEGLNGAALADVLR
jgi:DNA-binding NarL/FixJ family response regulator